MKPIEEFIYIGPGEFRGCKYRMVFAEPDEMVLIGQSAAWAGPVELFRRHFKPAP